MLNKSVILVSMRRFLVRAAGSAFCGAILGVALFGAAVIHSGANAMVVGPGEAFAIKFTVPATPTIRGGAVGKLVLTAPGARLSGPRIPVGAQLFDDGTVFGSGDAPFSALSAYAAPMSLFAGIPANSNSGVDGSIPGQIRLTPDFPGGVEFVDFGTATLIAEAVQATSDRGVVRGEPFARIVPPSVVDAAPVSAVPPPESLVLSLSALAVLGFLVWRQGTLSSTSRESDLHPSSVT